jgi:hypothetical protein
LKIPFNDPRKPYDDKQNYEHFIDWLEYIGRYGQLEPSDADVNKLIDANIENGLYLYMSEDMEDSNLGENARMTIRDLFDECNDDENYLRLYFNLPEEWYTNPPYDILEYLDEIGGEYDVSKMKNVLTDDGVEKFNETMAQYFKDSFDEYGFPDELTIDDRGLIYIEREIMLPNIFSTQVATNREVKDYFELLKNYYKGSGPCWSWKLGCAESYCGDSYGTSNTEIVLKGWVDPMSVDWAETLYRNAYSLNEECELYLREGNIVEIDEVVVNDYSQNHGKHILNKPMLIPV